MSRRLKAALINWVKEWRSLSGSGARRRRMEEEEEEPPISPNEKVSKVHLTKAKVGDAGRKKAVRK